MTKTKNVELIEYLAEVAWAINLHTKYLHKKKEELRDYKRLQYYNAIAKTLHNIAVLERLLLILEKKYNRILKQLTDEA